MGCLHNKKLNPSVNPVPNSFADHEQWNQQNGWKNCLNNLQLILQPFVTFIVISNKTENVKAIYSKDFKRLKCLRFSENDYNLILKWLKVFPIPHLSLGFPRLIARMNEFDFLQYLVYCWDDFCYSSA